MKRSLTGVTMDIRHEQRIRIMQVLYNQDVRQISLDEALLVVSPFEDIATKCSNILAQMPTLDALIESNLTGWTLSRLNAVDRAILRLSVFEMTEEKLPAAIVIDQAIELSKEYSETDDTLTSKFNNKVLDTIKQSVKYE
jgi:N utilization substance protein B